MLTPDYLQTAPDNLCKLWQNVEDDILADVCRRISKVGNLTSTAQWQLMRLQETRRVRKSVTKIIKQNTGKSDAEIRNILRQAGTMSLLADDLIHREAGKAISALNDSPILLNLINAGYQQTKGTFHNLTATTAQTVSQEFETRLDRAWLQIASGAFDSHTAIKRATDDLADHMNYITYPSGHVDKIDVACRRAVVTGVNQTAAKLQIQRMDDMDCEFVEVTAHDGARPTHAVWQGKVYHRGGAVDYKGKHYADFVESTGYGTGEGLCGWNCRHNFFPFYPDISKRAYTDAELQNWQNSDTYEKTQRMRALERNVRKYKRRYIADKAAGIDSLEDAAKLKSARDKLKRYAASTDQKVDSYRTSTTGFGRSESAHANADAETYHKEWLKGINASSTNLNSLVKYFDAKYNGTAEYNLLQGYAKAVNKGDISPLVGFDLYMDTANDIQKQIVGITAADGTEIKGFATHFIDRVIGQVGDSHDGMRQGTPIDLVLDALKNPVSAPSEYIRGNDIRRHFIGEYASVTISVSDGKLIQTNRR